MLWPNATQRGASGAVSIGGCAVEDLAAEFGTPLYVFDEETLVQRARRLVTAFDACRPGTQVVYGGKAYLSPTILRLLTLEGIGLDVVSAGEIWGGLKAGVTADRMVLHGNNKPVDELRMAIEVGVGLIVLDNEEEISRLNVIAGELYGQSGKIRTKVRVALRLNPGVDVHTHAKISTGIVDSKFGFPLWDDSALAAMERLRTCEHLVLEGLHMHLGSQLDGYDALPLAIDRQVEFAGRIKSEFGFELGTYSPGGGLGIAYTEDQIDSDPRLWAEVITSSYLESWSRHNVAAGTIVVEPGRWLVGPAAVALYRVGSVKHIDGVRTYVAVDGGMADNIRPTMYDARYTAEILNRNATGDGKSVRIAGRYCESGDVLIEDIVLPPVEVGDLIGIPAAGAYQIPMASNYNAVPRPAVVMVKDGSSRLMRRRETYDDVFRCEVFPE
jgi:diaminopimelate decarboxylase